MVSREGTPNLGALRRSFSCLLVSFLDMCFCQYSSQKANDGIETQAGWESLQELGLNAMRNIKERQRQRETVSKQHTNILRKNSGLLSLVTGDQSAGENPVKITSVWALPEPCPPLMSLSPLYPTWVVGGLSHMLCRCGFLCLHSFPLPQPQQPTHHKAVQLPRHFL